MTKADLVEKVTASIARTAGPMISKKDCARVVDAFLEAFPLTSAGRPTDRVDGLSILTSDL